MECLTFDSLKTKLYNEFTSYGLRVICCPIEGCQETYAGIQVETGTYRHELMIDKTRIPQGTALLLKDLLFFLVFSLHLVLINNLPKKIFKNK